MTQAFNLSQLANNLNSSGQLDATDGLSGTVPIASGGTGTSSPALVAGSGIAITGSFPNQTITNSSPGVVYTAGNGINISGGAVSVACPTFNTIGSYCLGWFPYGAGGGDTISTGDNVAAGSGRYQLQTVVFSVNGETTNTIQNILSGTWKWMACTAGGGYAYGNGIVGLICRVS